LIFVLFLMLVAEFIYMFPALFQGWYISGDIRKNYFMLRYIDPAFFPDDILADGFRDYMPLGFKLVMFSLVKLLSSAYAAVNAVAGIMALLAAYYFFKLTTRLKGRVFACFAVIFFILFYYASIMGQGGTVRTTGTILILAFLNYCVRNKPVPAMVVTALSILFYPVLFLGFFITLAITLFRKRVIFFKQKESFYFLVMCAASGVFLFLTLHTHPFYKIASPEKPMEMIDLKSFNPADSPEQLDLVEPQSTYILGRGIRYLFTVAFFNEQILSVNPFKTAGLFFWFLILETLVLTCLRPVVPVNRKPFLFIAVFIVSIFFAYFAFINRFMSNVGIITWIALYLAAASLFLVPKPSRDLAYDIYVYTAVSFVIFGGMILLPPGMAEKVHWPNRQLNPLIPLVIILVACGGLSYIFKKAGKKTRTVIAMYMLALIIGYCFIGHSDHYLYAAGDKNVYLFMRTLPKDAVIITHPKKADFIPFFGERSVLTAAEYNVVYLKDIWNTVSERTDDVLQLIYAHNEEDALAVCRKYAAGHNIYVLVDAAYYRKGFMRKAYFFGMPFRKGRKDLTDKDEFYLLNIDKRLRLYEDKNAFIFKASDFLSMHDNQDKV